MSSFSFKQAFGREKPHSSITDWVEILTGPNIAEEAYDGIPELVESINLQASGPAEAARALRKKLKHGQPHQQYRALVLLKALVENSGAKFHSAMTSDGQLTDTLRLVASDPIGDKRVKKKLALVLGAWREQYQDDPSMAYFANLYKQCRISERLKQADMYSLLGAPPLEEDKRKMEKAKLKEEKRAAKERARAEEEERARAAQKPRTRRVPFDFERDKPKVLESIVEASQASSNLMNAITLVNLEKETLEENTRVQECLAKAKQARKTVMRYTQLVENEELIGTLIESTERVNNAIDTYDQLIAAGNAGDAEITDSITSKLAATNLSNEEDSDQELHFSTSKSRSIDYSPPHQSRQVHPDLEDLQFGALGSASSHLPPPLQPSRLGNRLDANDDDNEYNRRGSLSDFSDYESSDEETHKARAGPSTSRKAYVTVSDDDDIVSRFTPPSRSTPSKVEEEDPFADPFADDLATRR